MTGRINIATYASAALAALLALGVLLLLPEGAAAAPKCAGKRATIVGTPGNDRLTGGPGRDRLIGGPGKDRTFK